MPPPHCLAASRPATAARQPGQRGSASRDTNIWEKGSDNLLHNDNNMAQLRFEHWLNDDWT
ncbi:hypothetical protein, partial [Pseudomonas sp. 51_B]|uniref:hypothetical protein n=1 Tax=Pseudomonas sp. 51_B TaxID=2813573 RepID=UPI001A9D1E4F